MRVFGTKSESIGSVYQVTDSDNVQLHSIHANPTTSDHPWPMELVRVRHSTDLDFRNLYWPGAPSPRLLVGDDSGGEAVHRSEFVLLVWNLRPELCRPETRNDSGPVRPRSIAEPWSSRVRLPEFRLDDLEDVVDAAGRRPRP